MQAAFANWIVDTIQIEARYAQKQAVTLVELAKVNLQICWCNVKIFWYS